MTPGLTENTIALVDRPPQRLSSQRVLILPHPQNLHDVAREMIVDLAMARIGPR